MVAPISLYPQYRHPPVIAPIPLVCCVFAIFSILGSQILSNVLEASHKKHVTSKLQNSWLVCLWWFLSCMEVSNTCNGMIPPNSHHLVICHKKNIMIRFGSPVLLEKASSLACEHSPHIDLLIQSKVYMYTYFVWKKHMLPGYTFWAFQWIQALQCIYINMYVCIYIYTYICIYFFKRMHQQMHTSWYGYLLENHPTLKHRTEHTYTHAHTFKEQQISRLRSPAPLKHRTSTNKPKMSKLDRSSFDVKTSSAEFSKHFCWKLYFK